MNAAERAMESKTDRRLRLARQLLAQADELHATMQKQTELDEQFVANAPPELAAALEAPTEVRKKKAASAWSSTPTAMQQRKAPPSEKIISVEAEIRRQQQRANMAKNALKAAQHPTLKSKPPQRSSVTFSAAVKAEASDGASEPSLAEEETRRQRAEFFKLQAEMKRAQEEVQALKEREMALSGVIASVVPKGKKAATAKTVDRALAEAGRRRE